MYSSSAESLNAGTSTAVVATTPMIAVVQERDTVWKLSELMRFLINVGQLDKRMLYVMYETYACKTYVKQLLFNGNLIEMEWSLRLLWHMAYLDERVLGLVADDFALCSFIAGLTLSPLPSPSPRHNHNSKHHHHHHHQQQHHQHHHQQQHQQQQLKTIHKYASLLANLIEASNGRQSARCCPSNSGNSSSKPQSATLTTPRRHKLERSTRPLTLKYKLSCDKANNNCSNSSNSSSSSSSSSNSSNSSNSKFTSLEHVFRI